MQASTLIGKASPGTRRSALLLVVGGLLLTTALFPLVTALGGMGVAPSTTTIVRDAGVATIACAGVAALAVRRHRARTAVQRTRDFSVAMRQVLDVVNDGLGQLQQLRVAAAHALPDETLATFDRAVTDTTSRLRLLADSGPEGCGAGPVAARAKPGRRSRAATRPESGLTVAPGDRNEQILEFLRRDVVPQLLGEYPPEALPALRARFEREYPDLELLPAAPAESRLRSLRV